MPLPKVSQKLPRKRFEVKLSSRRGPLNTPNPPPIHSPSPTFHDRFHLLTSSFNSRDPGLFSFAKRAPSLLRSFPREAEGGKRSGFSSFLLTCLITPHFSSRVSGEYLLFIYFRIRRFIMISIYYIIIVLVCEQKWTEF